MHKREHMWDTFFILRTLLDFKNGNVKVKFSQGSKCCSQQNFKLSSGTRSFSKESIKLTACTFARKQASKHHILDCADLFHSCMRDSRPLRERKELSLTPSVLLHRVAFCTIFTSIRETMSERKRKRLQIRQYRSLFCVTLISPWPNLFPQRSLEKLLAGARKCTAQKTQSCCDRRSCYKVSCGELSLCKVLSTHCSATETFQPSSSFSSPP